MFRKRVDIFIIRNICKDSETDAAQYIKKKRPILPVKYNKNDYKNVRLQFDGEPLENINLCSDSSDTEEMVDN